MLVSRLLEKILPHDVFKNVEIQYKHFKLKDKTREYMLPYYYRHEKDAAKYCIFRYPLLDYGILAVARKYLFAYDWAVSNGYIPVVDFEFEDCIRKYEFDVDNLWDECFEQQLSVTEALQKRFVLVEQVCAENCYREETCQAINRTINDTNIHVMQENWRDYYSKVALYIDKCWKLQPAFADEIDKWYDEAFTGCTVLGVCLRENFSQDADKIRTNKEMIEIHKIHPSAPGVNEVAGIVERYMKEWNCDKILLSTMYQESEALFKKRFGKRVVCVPRKRASFQDSMRSEEIGLKSSKEWRDYTKENKVYIDAKSYVKEIAALSKCDYLIAAKSSGTAVALSLNGGKYKDIYILPDKNHVERY